MALNAVLSTYDGTASLTSGGKARALYIGDWSDYATDRAALLGQADPSDATLVCTEILSRKLQGQPCDKAEHQCTMTSALAAAAKTPDQPFKWRFEASGEMFTIGGEGWQWDGTNEPILNIKIPLTQHVTLTNVVLFGTRTSFNLSTFDAYMDKVNSGTFLGAAAGHVRFKTVSGQPRQIASGATVLDVEVHLVHRSISWNQFYNEKTGEWATAERVSDETKVYPSVDFDPLLAAPGA
jgi:hypothetical protein